MTFNGGKFKTPNEPDCERKDGVSVDDAVTVRRKKTPESVLE